MWAVRTAREDAMKEQEGAGKLARKDVKCVRAPMHTHCRPLLDTLMGIATVSITSES